MNKKTSVESTKVKPSMDQWLKEAKQHESASKIGMYLTHNGIVRETPKAKVRHGAETQNKVIGMHFSYDRQKVDGVIADTYKMDGIYYIRVWLAEGQLQVGDDIMYVLIGGDIRPHVVDALQYLVGRIKNECVEEIEKIKFFKENTEEEKAATLARKPVDMNTGKEVETCRYAFFPGCGLCVGEPEIVVKAYDSLRFQHPDTALHLQCCQTDTMRDNWESLGRPTLITACMGCRKKLSVNHPDIPTIPLYDLLKDMGISGGCHSQDYILHDPGMQEHPEGTVEAVKELADGMGVTFHSIEEDGQYPYLTYNIRIRDMCKREGKDAVHILELIYGMGDKTLATPEKQMENRIMLKKAMLELFWEE